MKTNPALLTDDYEIFVTEDQKVKAISKGRVFNFVKLPEKVIDIIKSDLEQNQKAKKMLSDWSYSGDFMYIKYMACRCGGFDHVPDIDIKNRKINPEYWDCPLRYKCEGSGIICQLPGGLTHRELEAIELLKTGEKKTAACQKMGISPNTFNTLLKSGYKKLNVNNKVACLNALGTC